MTISQINSYNNLSAMSQISSTNRTGQAMRMPPPPMNGEMGGVEQGDFSKPAEFFSQLLTLQTEDPEKFQEVVSEIADELEAAAADEESYGGETGMLSDLAAKFRDVANGGDIEQLRPPAPPPPPPMGAQNATDQYAYSEDVISSDIASSLDSSSSSQVQELLDKILSAKSSAKGTEEVDQTEAEAYRAKVKELLDSIFSSLDSIS